MGGKRRANGEGSIRQRTDGRWLVTYTVGMSADGRPKQVYRYTKSQREAVEKLNQLKAELGMGIDFSGGTIKTGEWCLLWVNTYKKKLASSTRVSYLNNIRIHILPFLGGVAINKLTTQQIQFMLDTIYNEGETSSSLFVKVYNVLNGALVKAVQLGKLVKNPCEGIAFPKDTHKDIRVMTLAEQRAFIKALENEEPPLQAMMMTYLYTGTRVGEIPALTWRDVDLAGRVIDINKKVVVVHDFYAEGKKSWQEVQNFCKTVSSVRQIVITPLLVGILTEHMTWQKRQTKSLGLTWSEDNLVFPTGNGTVPYVRNVQEKFQRIANGAGILNATTHAMRHTYATRLYENDIDIKVISAQLGHKSVKTTYDIYVHVFKDKKIAEMDKLNVLDSIAL